MSFIFLSLPFEKELQEMVGLKNQAFCFGNCKSTQGHNVSLSNSGTEALLLYVVKCWHICDLKMNKPKNYLWLFTAMK